MGGAGRVAIVCIAYNHGQWIEETLDSVRLQDYPDLQLIVVDNGSTDNTAERIRAWVAYSAGSLPVQTIYLTESQPYCQLFNRVISTLEGQFMIDLSGDDVLYPRHVSSSVSAMVANPGAAFSFSDATIMEHTGEESGYYKRDRSGVLTNVPDLEKLYVILISRSCTSSPAVRFDAAVLRQEGGYQAVLLYEEVDNSVRMP